MAYVPVCGADTGYHVPHVRDNKLCFYLKEPLRKAAKLRKEIYYIALDDVCWEMQRFLATRRPDDGTPQIFIGRYEQALRFFHFSV